MKTLVVKLAGTVEDSSLKKFGEFTFTAKAISAANYNSDNCNLLVHCRNSVKLEIIGDGYFTDQALTANLGKTITIPNNSGKNMYLSNGNYTVKMSSKYDVTGLRLGPIGKNVPEFVLTFDSSQLADMTALQELKLDGTKTVYVDLSTLQYLTNIRLLYLRNSPHRISGNIANIAGMTQVNEAYFDWLPEVVGDTSSIAHLHPNNGGNLQYFNFKGSGITGNWPPA